MSDAKPQSPEKREFIAKSKTFWNPGKTQAGRTWASIW